MVQGLYGSGNLEVVRMREDAIVPLVAMPLVMDGCQELVRALVTAFNSIAM